MSKSKKTTQQKTPFKVPKGKTQLHLLVAVDDKGDVSFHEPPPHQGENDAIESAIYEHGASEERVVDVYHYVIEPKPPKPRKLAAKKKVTKSRKLRDGKAEDAKAERAKKAEEAKAAKEKKAADAKAKKAAKKTGSKPSTKQETPSKKKAAKRASKKISDATPAPADEGNRSSQDESGNWS